MQNPPDQIATQITRALLEPHQIEPLSATPDRLTLTQAYDIANRVCRQLGRTRAGRKVGFTNRGIWDSYNVDRPVWGEVHTEGLFESGQPVALAAYSQPRIEPEIVLGLAQTPEPDMDRAALMACVAWVAPGFEIVQSIYPGWRFEVADTIAAQALHGALVLGEKHAMNASGLEALAEVPVTLLRDGQHVETGVGANALDGPVEVLMHLVQLLGPDQALQAGELVTTGTLTDAWPIHPGEVWQADYGGVMDVTLETPFT